MPKVTGRVAREPPVVDTARPVTTAPSVTNAANQNVPTSAFVEGHRTEQPAIATTEVHAYAARQAIRPGDSPAVDAATQNRTLTAIFDRVSAVAATGQTPIVELDLDLTALLPRQRVLTILRDIAREHPAITEFATPERLPFLPGYTEGAIEGFVKHSGLAEKYPQLDLYEIIHSGLRAPYWDQPWESDVASPGLDAFIDEVRRRGGEVVFVSNRPGGLERSIATLEANGIDKPIVLTAGLLGRVIGDSAAKKWVQRDVRDYGVPVAVIDDRSSNRDAVVEANEGHEVISVAIAAPGFSWTPDAETSALRLSSFRFLDTL